VSTYRSSPRKSEGLSHRSCRKGRHVSNPYHGSEFYLTVSKSDAKPYMPEWAVGQTGQIKLALYGR
jgi:hypothetical protein